MSDSKVHWANMGPIWGRQDPGGPHVGPMNFAILDADIAICFWPNISCKQPAIFSHYTKAAVSNFLCLMLFP